VKKNTHSVIRGHVTSSLMYNCEERNKQAVSVFPAFREAGHCLAPLVMTSSERARAPAKLNAAKENEIRLFIVPKGE
jgi:hypothetical protein